MSNPNQKPRLNIVTPEFSAFGANLSQARKPEGFPNAKAKFSLSIPLTEAEAAPILEQLRELAKKSFPSMDEQGRVTRSNGDLVTVRLPVERGDAINAKRVAAGKKPFDFLAGKVVFKASADEGRQPPVCDMSGMPVAASKVNGGDTVRAQLGFLGVDVPGSFIGISCYLNGVLLVKSNTTRNAADMFTAFLNTGSADVNPFGGF